MTPTGDTGDIDPREVSEAIAKEVSQIKGFPMTRMPLSRIPMPEPRFLREAMEAVEQDMGRIIGEAIQASLQRMAQRSLSAREIDALLTGESPSQVYDRAFNEGWEAGVKAGFSNLDPAILRMAEGTPDPLIPRLADLLGTDEATARDWLIAKVSVFRGESEADTEARLG